MNPIKKWREEKRKFREEIANSFKESVFGYETACRLYAKVVDKNLDGELSDKLMQEAGEIQNRLIELRDKLSKIWGRLA